MIKYYTNVEYVPGVLENYRYLGTQEGMTERDSIDLFNGDQTGNTISRQTIEDLLKNDQY